MIRVVSVAVMVLMLFGGLFALASDSTSSTVSSQPVAKDVLNDLLRQGPPVTPPTMQPQSLQSKRKKQAFESPVILPTGKAAPRQKLLPEGHHISDRRGRIVRSGEQWVFVFESDGKALADPPITVLPNSWLEKIEVGLTARGAGAIYRVSGEVTCYHGRNYLLLRKVLIELETSSGHIR